MSEAMSRPATLAAKFAEFDSANPMVWALFIRFSFDAISRGFEHFGVASVVERIRWFTAVETRGDIYKINNNFAAFYVRKFERTFPQHRGFFRKRVSVADYVEELMR